MSYVSIVEKLNKQIDRANIAEHYANQENNFQDASFYRDEYRRLKNKKEKILKKLDIKVQEHAICDEGGNIVCIDYTVTINKKHRKLSDIVKNNYWVDKSILPNGKTVKESAIAAQHYYV